MPNILFLDVALLVLTEAELEDARLLFFSPSPLCPLRAVMGLHLITLCSSIISHLYIHFILLSFICFWLLSSKGWWLSLILITVPCNWVLIGDLTLWPCWLTCLWCRLYLALSPFHSGSLTHKGRSEALSVNSKVHFLHGPCWRPHMSLNNVLFHNCNRWPIYRGAVFFFSYTWCKKLHVATDG